MESMAGKKRWALAAMDIVLFVVFAFGIMMLVSMPFTSLLAQYSGGELAENVPVFILNETLMLIGVFLSAWMILRFRGLSLVGLGLSLKGRGKDFGAGILFAVVLYAMGFGLSLLLGVIEITGIECHLSSLLTTFSLFLLVAITEELAVRGFILGRLLDAGINKYCALVLSAILFSLMHLFNPNFAFLPFLNIVLAGVLLGASYIYTRNLCFPIALHWFWNWLQGPVLGYEVSGNEFGDGLLTLHLSDAELLNGGTFGFEGSIICTVLMVLGTAVIIKHYSSSSKD